MKKYLFTPIKSTGHRKAFTLIEILIVIALLTLLMATLNSPRLLLLDEHTAALDPKTAAKVLDITDKIVEEKRLTTIMITHNMKDALNHGNRLVMMNEGKIIADVRGEEKRRLTVDDLMQMFSQSGTVSDRAVLA